MCTETGKRKPPLTGTQHPASVAVDGGPSWVTCDPLHPLPQLENLEQVHPAVCQYVALAGSVSRARDS